MEVNLEPSDFLNCRVSYKTSNYSETTLYKHSFTLSEDKLYNS